MGGFGARPPLRTATGRIGVIIRGLQRKGCFLMGGVGCESAPAGGPAASIAQGGAHYSRPRAGRERKNHMVAVKEAQYQDAGVRELERDSAKRLLRVIGVQRSVRQCHGYRVRSQPLVAWQFLILLHYTA